MLLYFILILWPNLLYTILFCILPSVDFLKAQFVINTFIYFQQILNLSGKTNKLKIKEEKAQNKLKHGKNIQSEIIRLKLVLEEKISDKDKITSTVDQNRKINMKVNNKLILLKKELEDNKTLNNNLKKDNDTLQSKIEQLEFAMHEVKQAWKIKQWDNYL